MKTFREFVEIIQQLEESSSDEKRRTRRTRTGRTRRGMLTLARGRGADMTPQERTTAAIAKKAGFRGTGKYSTKDLRGRISVNTTYDPTSDEEGSTNVDTFVTSLPSARAAMRRDLGIISKRGPEGQHLSSRDSIIKAGDLRKAIVRSGGNKKGRVHHVSITGDPIREKDDPKGRMTIGRNLAQAVKDIPKRLKTVGAKKGDIVTGQPLGVLSGEDEKTGAKKREKMYIRILPGATKRSSKTGLMVGTVREFLEL